MSVYVNHTQKFAVVTVRVTAVNDQGTALKIGVGEHFEDQDAGVGVHDVQVGPGQAIELGEGTEAEFLAARAG